MIQELYKLYKDVEFTEHDHKYRNVKTGQEYISVTTIKKKFKQTVNWEYWKLYKALQRSGYKVKSVHPVRVEGVNFIIVDGKKLTIPIIEDNIPLTVTVADIDREWQEKKDLGTARGSKIHNYLEDGWRGKFPNERIDFLDNFLKTKKEEIAPIGLEVIVADDKLGISGQFDGLFFKEEKIQLRDTKTDKEFKDSFMGKRLLYPFNNLYESTLGEYTIQLNLYTLIIEHNTSIRIDELFIDHFDKEGNYTEIPVEKLNLDYETIRRAIHN